MVIRKSDLTNEAIELGIWEALLEEAGIGVHSDGADDAEVEILKARNANV